VTSKNSRKRKIGEPHRCGFKREISRRKERTAVPMRAQGVFGGIFREVKREIKGTPCGTFQGKVRSSSGSVHPEKSGSTPGGRAQEIWEPGCHQPHLKGTPRRRRKIRRRDVPIVGPVVSGAFSFSPKTSGGRSKTPVNEKEVGINQDP